MPKNSAPARQPIPWMPPGPAITFVDLRPIWDRLDEGARRVLMTVAYALDPLATEGQIKAMSKTLTAKTGPCSGSPRQP